MPSFGHWQFPEMAELLIMKRGENRRLSHADEDAERLAP
jgi:hypothetical protein